MRRATLVAALCLLAACQEPPPDRTTPSYTTGTTGTTLPSTTTSSTTFPTDTTFGGLEDIEPAHWLNLTETGTWTRTPAGGPYTGVSGDFTLQEVVDELDIEEGPDCLVTWTISGTEPLNPGNCAGCDDPWIVEFTVSTGDPSLCQSNDPPPTPSEPSWRMAWHPGDQMIYRNMNGTSVWIPWWPATAVGDTLTIDYLSAWPIYVDEEM